MFDETEIRKSSHGVSLLFKELFTSNIKIFKIPWQISRNSSSPFWQSYSKSQIARLKYFSLFLHLKNSEFPKFSTKIFLNE